LGARPRRSTAILPPHTIDMGETMTTTEAMTTLDHDTDGSDGGED
jgi:hypothetical protein